MEKAMKQAKIAEKMTTKAFRESKDAPVGVNYIKGKDGKNCFLLQYMKEMF